MPNLTKVLIAIQARSNSTRFPQKIFEKIGKKMVIQHVIDAAISAKRYAEYAQKPVLCEVAILHPENDDQIKTLCKGMGAKLIGGDELNVLSRYVKAQRETNADYVVRLTSDCPLMLDFIISKHINVAKFNNLDYVSNVESGCRQVADGFDCEIMSARALEWLHNYAHTDYEKEHVTVAIRERKPSELRQGFVSSKIDSSNLKLSLDTRDDLDSIRKYYHAKEEKLDMAFKIFGEGNVFKI